MLYGYYEATIESVVTNSKRRLKRLSPYLPFSCVTVNFGPRTICFSHRDLLNLAWGWCVILVLGRFDCQKGGHIVLHEPKVILEVGHGDIVCIPSACIAHGNIPVGEGETRYSVTWYTPAGIFQWIAAGFRTLKSLATHVDGAAKGVPGGMSGGERWEWGCGMMSTLQELRDHWNGSGVAAPDTRP